MHVTAKTVYSIIAVVELAGSPKGEAVKVSKIAEKHGIPKRFLEISLSELRSSGIVDSKKGAKGGFFLSKNVEDISMYDIIKITESNVEIFNCEKYIENENCLLKSIFNNLNTEIGNILKDMTFEEILKMLEDDRKVVNFII